MKREGEHECSFAAPVPRLSDSNPRRSEMPIIVDTNNRLENHPEVVHLERYVQIKQYPLPVGDYVVETALAAELLENVKREAWVSKKFKGTEFDYKPTKLDFAGTFSVAVDTKKEEELYRCLELVSDRYRFERELIRARNLGVELYILTISDTYTAGEDFESIGYCTRTGYECGKKLLEEMKHLEEQYPVHFIFCPEDPETVASSIIQILLLENVEAAPKAA